MKGIVFTELCEMIEKEFGVATLNDVIDKSDLASEGVYSAVGTYDSAELISLVTNLSEKTSIDAPKLVHAYGRYFFDVLTDKYGAFFEKKDTFSFLKSIDDHIHVEVKKLYPDAELPKFSHSESEDSLELKYSSPRGLSLFALGLIEKTIDHYKEDILVERKELKEDGTEVLFTLKKN